MIRRLLLTVLASLAMSVMYASLALADDAPTPSARVRAPNSVLRHVDVQTLEVPPTARPDTHRKQVVILVGGYQSCSCIDDHALDLYRDRFISAGYDVVRFGQDPRYPYDTLGHIVPSARALRDEARDLGKEYAGVHIVTHSMGGAVADQAFADGLSASDGVLTYVSLAGPHSGSDAARGLAAVRTFGGDESLLQDIAHHFGQETNSAATRELTAVVPIAPPPGVVRLDLREADDLLVTARDTRDPGVTSRTLLSGWRNPDGHGAILVDQHAIDLTAQTIATRRIPPDNRAESLMAAAVSSIASALMIAVICGLTVGLCTRLIDRRKFGWVVHVVKTLLKGRGRCA